MNNAAFRGHIKTVSKAQLDRYFTGVTAKLARARAAPSSRIGDAVALDGLVCEAGMRRYAPCPGAAGISGAGLLAQLLQ